MDHFHLPPKHIYLCVQPQTLHKSIRKESEAPPGNRTDRYVLSKQNGNTQLGRHPEQKSSPCIGHFGAGRQEQEVGGDQWAGSRGYGNAMRILRLGCEIIVPSLS